MDTRSDDAGARRKISPATESALWALSNGTCYAPGCSMPVVVEVRPGIYKKNAQVAHIYGVRGARRQSSLSTEVRDSFAHLLLLCLPHHAAVDDKKDGEKYYPAEMLFQWKERHEGSHHALLSRLTFANDEALEGYLERVYEPPLKRLENIAERLERTGEINQQSVAELNEIAALLANRPLAADERVASSLAFAADSFGSMNLANIARQLVEAADSLRHLPRGLRGEY